MSRLLFVVFAVLLLAPGVGRAEDMPRQLNDELIRTERANCKTSTGYGQKFVVLRDVDGDGRRDVVLDYAEALCGVENALALYGPVEAAPSLEAIRARLAA